MVEALGQDQQEQEVTGYFNPKNKLGILIGISDYSEINANQDKGRFENLPNVTSNLTTMKTGLEEFGFTSEQITAKTEANYSQIDKIFRDAKEKVEANYNKREETLAYVYFGGHGVTDKGMTHAVCGKYDSTKRNQWTYQIEMEIQKLAKREGVYVVALLDCGREPLKTNDIESAATEINSTQTKENAKMRLIISYKCPINSKVVDQTPIPQQYLKQLKSMAAFETG